MLIKTFFYSSDYVRTLRRRRWLFAGMSLFGIVLALLAQFAFPSFGISDFIQGFYLGGGSGLTLAGIVFFARTRWLLRHPDRAKQAQISETDEREKAILRAAVNSTFGVLYVALILGILLALPFSMPIFFTLFALFLLVGLTMLLSSLWFKRHM